MYKTRLEVSMNLKLNFQITSGVIGQLLTGLIRIRAFKLPTISFTVLLAIVCSTTTFGQKCATRQDTITNRTIYVLADKMPTFQVGLDSLKSKINKYLKWPERCSVEGAVYVSFIIETNGQITNKRIKKESQVKSFAMPTVRL